MTMPADTKIKIEPFKRGDDYLIANFVSERGTHITDREYHAVRDQIMEMRSRDPQTARLFDKFLDTSILKRGSLPDAEMKALTKGLENNKMGLGPLTNSIGADLKLNNYSSSYRPEIMVSVNERPMVPSVVASQLKGAKVEGDFSIQRSDKPGVVTGRPMSFEGSERVKLLPPAETNRMGLNRDETGSKIMKAELVNHIRWKTMFKGIAGMGAALTAGLAAAAEPGATPVKVADAVIDTQIPGWQAARQGQACKAFGEAAGVVAGGAAMVATAPVVATAAVGVTAASGPAAPVVGVLAATAATGAVVGAGAVTTAAVAPAAESLCNVTKTATNYIAQKLSM
jgi:hypothetical protein